MDQPQPWALLRLVHRAVVPVSVRESAITAVLDRIDLQLAADSDEVVLTRDEAETLAKAFELLTNYTSRLELEVATHN